MAYIDYEILNKYIELFGLYISMKNRQLGSFSSEVSFGEATSWIYKQEHFKYEIREEAVKKLDLIKWNKDMIGTGTIANNVLSAINVKDNILVHYQQKMHLKNVIQENLYEAERVLYDVFMSNELELSFENLCRVFGRKYDLISFFYFLKDSTKYMQVRSSEFDNRFKILNIDFKVLGNCCWDNYVTYNNILFEIQETLNNSLSSAVNLLDAHSFVWVIGEADFLEWSKKQSKELDSKVIIGYEKYKEYNEPRIKTKDDWIKVLNAEKTYSGFNFIENVLLPVYQKKGHLIFCKEFEKETNQAALNIRVGEFRNRIRKILDLDHLPLQLDESGIDIAWNIPFMSNEVINNSPKNKGKFCWILRPELIDALEEIYGKSTIEEPQLFIIGELQDIAVSTVLSQAKNKDIEYRNSLTYGKKKDYEKVQRQNKLIGDSGEKRVVQFEQRKLQDLGMNEYIDKVHIVDSDSYGYDVVSYDEHGNTMHIEVKTCTSNQFVFYISQHEISVAKEDPEYHLYYLYDIRGKAKIIRYNSVEIQELLEKYSQPTNYIVEFEIK